MLHSLSCDRPYFKTIEFKPGFNVILADRKTEASEKDSRNGLGKSTLIEIIQFCLGGNKGETLQKPQLKNWSFTLKLDLNGEKYSVTRNTDNSNDIIIDGDCSSWPIEPTFDSEVGNKILSRNDWNEVLGSLMFDLQPNYQYKYNPTFRSLISYFARKNGHSGAFLSPFQHFKNQLEWDKQVNNAFLLGLGWEFAAKLQELKDQGVLLSDIKKGLEEAKPGSTPVLFNVLGHNSGELESLKIRLQDQIEKEKTQLDTFRVVPQYEEIEKEANQITVDTHELVNRNISDKLLIEYYEANLKEEVDAEPSRIKNLYEEAGIIFTENITKSISDVLLFHKNVVANRKEYLQLEIQKIKQKIADRKKQIDDLTSRRSELLLALKAGGALQEWTELQNNHQTAVAQLKDVSNKLENLKKFEQGQSSITVDQELIKRNAKQDLNERKSQREAAILAFNNYSKALYSVPGTLSIDFTKTGFKFNVDIERSGSQGIDCMKIFCYDLVLAKLWAKKEEGQIFLIHDSLLFDSVDERQKAAALQLAASESEKEKFQYICTMNSDNVPRNEFRDFNFDKYVIKTFTDASERGGLLGIRF